ncbi:MAG: GtrA family protein [Lachnospiraceae bacterium]
MNDIKRLTKYGITVILTIGVNFTVYFLLWYNGVNYLDANAAAWIVAVIFSFLMNRRAVFQLENICYKEMIILLIETLVLFLAVDGLNISSVAAKIFISTITILGNYMSCQKKGFANGGDHNE